MQKENVAEAKIVKKGSKFCVVSKDGTRNFGCYDTKEEALKRLRQVEFFKHQNSSDVVSVKCHLDVKASKDIKTFEKKAIASADVEEVLKRNTIGELDFEKEE